ncbi:hypothetical protein Gotur_025653 [Gossypium turneri]
MRHRVPICFDLIDEALGVNFIALGTVITLDLSDEALDAKLVCSLDPCIRSRVGRKKYELRPNGVSGSSQCSGSLNLESGRILG